MRRLSLLALVMLLICGFTLPLLAQGFVGKIVVAGVPDRYKAGNGGQSTYGLKSVGIGTRVVLKATALGNANAVPGWRYNDTNLVVTSAAWTITSPSGSAVTALTDTTAAGNNGTVVYFVPDKVGQYTVNMTATTPKGACAQVSVTITAAAWVGVSISQTWTSGLPSGCMCHGFDNTPFTAWKTSMHAQGFKRKVDNLDKVGAPIATAGHFSNNCMSCHTIGTYGTGGYTDYKAKLGFSVPTWNHQGVFDSLVTESNKGTTYADSLKKLLSFTGIQCENCHGAAGEHAKTGDKAKIAKSLGAEVCAPCHYSSDRHGIGYAWEGSLHAKAINNGSASSVESFNRRFCNRCHTGEGYLNQTLAGLPEPVVPTPNNKIWDGAHNVTCQVCHDPHSAANPAQLRVKSVAEACVGCHTIRLSSNLHAAHQGPMLKGTANPSIAMSDLEKYRVAGLQKDTLGQNVAAFGNWAGYRLPGKYAYVNSAHSSTEGLCAGCHMAKSPSFLASEASNFTKADTMLNKLGGHTFMVAATVGTTEVLNTTGCQECHGTVSFTMIEETQTKTKALLQLLYNALPNRDTTVTTSDGIAITKGNVVNPSDTVTYQGITAGRTKRALTAIERAASFNYFFVKNEGSFGVHNFRYAEALIMNSIEQLQLGNGAVKSILVKDRPNDNGRYVRVAWQPFPAEKSSTPPVTEYYIFQRVTVKGNAPANKVNSIGDAIKQAEAGRVFKVSDFYAFKTFGPYPATGSTMVADISTDGDSSAVLNYAVVQVVGKSTDKSVVFASPWDSSYSVVNMSAAPSGLNASASNAGILLKWNAPASDDPDGLVGYTYNVFRGTSAGFDVSTATPIVSNVAEMQYVDKSLTSGATYFYKVVAKVKGSSVLSAPSTEASALATSVTEIGSGMPTEFALNQNYPNPFNPSTEIRFALPTSAHVKISIYNVAGVEVRSLVNESLDAGFKNVTWDGKNNSGNTVSSGVYLYRIQAGSFVSTKKMVMLK